MHFIKRSNCPDFLVDNKEQWTAPWIAFYRWDKGASDGEKKPEKPSDGHWRNDEIRLILIDDFHNNCGYCGDALPTPQEDNVLEHEDRKFASKGDVDHLLPKAIEPELVYEWTNYIWSCKPCNQLKREFFSRIHPLLNPCSEYDCSKLEFIEDTGQYTLQNSVSGDTNWQQRLKNSEQKTLLNSVEICQKRKLRISFLSQRFISVNKNIENVKKLQAIQLNVNIIGDLQNQIDSNVDEIKQIIVGPDFICLLKNKYETLLHEYPLVAALLV